MFEFIFIGIFAFIFLTIFIFTVINNYKINKKAKKPEIKTDDKSKNAENVEVKTEISKEKPLEKAIKEANVEYQIKEAFEKIEQERAEYESQNSNSNKSSGGRLKLDRGDFRTELQMSLEQSVISSETNTISSATAKMDNDYSYIQQGTDLDKQIAVEHEIKNNSNQDISEEINNMSPEMKTILFNDILNKKY